MNEKVKRMTQKERILRHLLDYGRITSWEAYANYGITRLSAIIFNLKRDNYEFEDKMIATINRYNEKVYFKDYILKKEGEHNEKEV